jgi:hypothetical protein
LGLRSFQVEVISFVAKSRRASSPSIRCRAQSEKCSRFEALQSGGGENPRKRIVFPYRKSMSKACSNKKIKPTMRLVFQCFRMQSFRRIAAYQIVRKYQE